MNTANSKRIIQVQGGYNFRDLGGLKTKDGKLLKSNLLFRTDELGTLTDADLDLLTSKKVQTIVDFRTDLERSKSVDRIPLSCKKEIHLDILSANMDAFIAEMQKGNADFKKLMLGFYEELVIGSNGIEKFKEFFEIVQDSSNVAIIYHCTAGKDRTGVATALILESLNVDREIIEDDYLLSNEFLKDKYASYINKDPRFADLFLVQADYLRTAFDAIEKTYDSVENYLKTVLKVDINKMRSFYLED